MEMLTGILSGLAALGTLLSVFSVVSGLVVFAAGWAFQGFTSLYTGRKAGLEKDWMPFVPFAKTIYKLKIVNEQWWKMFLFEGYVIYAAILFVLILAISAFQWFAFAVIVVAIYLLGCLAYNVYYRYKFYVAFDIMPHVAITVFIPGMNFFRDMLDILIAFTKNYDYGGVEKAQTIKSSAQNFANVPQGGPHAAPQMAKPGTISGLSGMYAGQDIPLATNEPLLIGRDGTCNLIIDRNAEKLSRKHCSIVYNSQSGVYMVTDYSSNGTYIDGGNRLVANMATQIQRGTIIALGNRENRFKLN